jgi:hypothetical protein
LLLGALALASCGGGDEESTSSTTQASSTTSTESTTTTTTTNHISQGRRDARQIVVTATAVVLGGNPDEVCGRMITQAFLRQGYGDEAGCLAALKAEQKTQPGPGADGNPHFGGIERKGDTAVITAEPEFGPYAKQKVRVTLVLQDGRWQVDSLKSNAPVGP